MDLIMAYKEKWQGNNGVMNYINTHYPNLIPNKLDINQKFSFINKLQRKFLISINVKYVRNKEHYKTQKNWKKFKEYLKNNH